MITAVSPISFYAYEQSEGSIGTWGWRPLKFSNHGTVFDATEIFSVLTWNVWYSELEQQKRFIGIIRRLVELPHLDVVSLQEVTPRFFEWLQCRPEIQSDWILTNPFDAEHRLEVPENGYGCMFLTRRKWRTNVRAWLKKFPTSTMGRFLIVAEIFGENDECQVQSCVACRL
jgi:endonuclease/exonuclease/phosphatase family metal-dependent hydrolase